MRQAEDTIVRITGGPFRGSYGILRRYVNDHVALVTVERRPAPVVQDRNLCTVIPTPFYTYTEHYVARAHLEV